MRAERPAIPADEQRTIVEALPRRVAHATYALLALSRDGATPATTAEVCERDSEALSVSSTGSALHRALRHDLVDRWAPGLWSTRPHGVDLYAALEARFLHETDDDPAPAREEDR